MKILRLFLILCLTFCLTGLPRTVCAYEYPKETTSTATTRELALIAVKEHQTPSGKTIEEIVNDRSGQTLDHVRYGKVEWLARRLHQGQNVLITCTQERSPETGSLRMEPLRYQWLVEGRTLSAVSGNDLDDGLPVISRAQVMSKERHAPPPLTPR